MKSNTSIIAILALFVLISVVSGQTSSSSASGPAATNIAQCIKDKGCNDSDEHCRAECAGVPDPSNSDAKNTDDCVSKCDQSNTNAYAQCKANCINQNYFPQGSSPNSNSGSGSPSASSNSPSSTSSSSSGSSSSSSSGSSPSPSSKNNANGASPTNNAFTALVLCIVAGVMTLGF